MESLQRIGPDDESQDMSGQTTVPVVYSPAPSQIMEIGETQPSGSGSHCQQVGHSLLGVRHSHLGVGASKEAKAGKN